MRGRTILAAIGAVVVSLADAADSADAQRAGGVARAKPAKPAVRPGPAVVRIACDHADFTFYPAGKMADVVDRDFQDDVTTNVAELGVSPGTYVISWDRMMPTRLGTRTMRHRYLINRVTGLARVQTADEMMGMPSVTSDREQQCSITG